jgi:hypothetical protein
METVIAAVLELVRTHTGVMLPIVFGLAFGESLAFVTVVLVAIGGLIGAANVTFWPVRSACSLAGFSACFGASCRWSRGSVK